MQKYTFKSLLILWAALFFFGCEANQSLFSGKSGDNKKNTNKAAQNGSKDKGSTAHMQGNNLEIEQEDNSGSMGSASDSVDITGAFLINCEKSNELDESGKVPLNCRVEKEGQRYDSSEAIIWQIVEAANKTTVVPAEKGTISQITDQNWQAKASISLAWYYDINVSAQFDGYNLYWPNKDRGQDYSEAVMWLAGNGMLSPYEIVYANNRAVLTNGQGGFNDPMQFPDCSDEQMNGIQSNNKYDGVFEVTEDNTNLEIRFNDICGIGWLIESFSFPGEIALFNENSQVASRMISKGTSSVYFPVTVQKGIYTLTALCHGGRVIVNWSCDDFSMKDIHINSTNNKKLRWKSTSFP